MGHLRDRALTALSSERAVNLIGIATLVVLATLLVFVVGFGARRSTTDAIADGTDLQGCRSQYATAVTDARTALDLATSELTEANQRSNDAEDQVIITALFGTEDELNPALATLTARKGEAELVAKKLRPARDAYHKATAAYSEQVALSITDPQRFLVGCRSAK